MSATLPISPAEVARLADDLESRSAEDVLRVAVELFHPRLVLTCSWQKQSSVLVHMLSEIQPDVRVVEFDTGLLFRETYETRQKLIERYPVRFERIEPELSVAEQAAKHGDRLWERDPDGCCAMRKVEPLADWTNRDVWRYIWRHGIPYNPLHDHGYPSIGCVPCTASVDSGADERTGRWKGTGKVECGLHGD